MSLSRARARVNLVLLILVLALSGLLAVSYGGGRPQTVSGIAADSIRQITVARPGDLPFTLERSPRGWYLSAPGVAAISPRAEAELLAAGTAASMGQHQLSELDEAAAGLSPPRAVVKLNGSTRLEFGDRAALSGLRYVRVGDTVHMVDDRHYHSVNQALADIVDSRLLPAGSELTGLELGAWRLRWTGADWRDEGASASTDVARVARAWSNAEASVVGQLNPEAAQGEPLRMAIAQPERTLEMDLIPAPDGSGFYLARRDLGIAYHFPADRAPPLPPGASVQ